MAPKCMWFLSLEKRIVKGWKSAFPVMLINFSGCCVGPPDYAELEAVVASALDDRGVAHLHRRRVSTAQILLLLDRLLYRFRQFAVTNFLFDEKEGKLCPVLIFSGLWTHQRFAATTLSPHLRRRSPWHALWRTWSRPRWWWLPPSSLGQALRPPSLPLCMQPRR